ncbi:MAG: MogA/MoaB family molybdenum cofactor biosynthesis protein [Candidatus Bathyarchaeota archaeon]|nr:MogA/MoaB family molybdenum cofactor biosynthesis protein [Candidatus Bathyarchaeota archaeon]
MSESIEKHKASAPKHLNFAVFICSSTRYQQMRKTKKIADVSGDIIEALLTNSGHRVLSRQVIADDKSMIGDAVKKVLTSAELDAAIFCGGTGMSPKDVTIETVSPFFEKTLPGFGEIFRRLSYDRIGSAAVMSRAVAGIAKCKALFCIPGSPDAVRVSVETLILPETPHIVRHARE